LKIIRNVKLKNSYMETLSSSWWWCYKKFWYSSNLFERSI